MATVVNLTAKGDLHLDILGTQFVVSWGPAVTPAESAQIQRAWSRCQSTASVYAGVPAGEGSGTLPYTACLTRIEGTSAGTQLPLAAGSFAELSELVTSYLTLGAIDAHAGKLTMLHACGVADSGTGYVMALVAKSGTGKTTASRLLGQTFGYITDETVAIEPDGVVRPYPKPLSVKNGGAFKDQLGPDQLGLLPAPTRPVIHSIALLNRQAGRRGAPVIEPVSLAEGVLALIPDTSSQGRIPKPLQSLCRLLNNTGGLRRITYAEADHLPGLITEVLARPQEPAHNEWQAEFPVVEEAAALPAGGFRRVTFEDAVTIDGDLLLLSGGQVTRLSGIGPSLWKAAGSGASRQDLTDAVTREHGKPEGFEGLVDDALAHLLQQGVLVEVQA